MVSYKNCLKHNYPDMPVVLFSDLSLCDLHKERKQYAKNRGVDKEEEKVIEKKRKYYDFLRVKEKLEPYLLAVVV